MTEHDATILMWVFTGWLWVITLALAADKISDWVSNIPWMLRDTADHLMRKATRRS